MGEVRTFDGHLQGNSDRAFTRPRIGCALPRGSCLRQARHGVHVDTDPPAIEYNTAADLASELDYVREKLLSSLYHINRLRAIECTEVSHYIHHDDIHRGNISPPRSPVPRRTSPANQVRHPRPFMKTPLHLIPPSRKLSRRPHAVHPLPASSTRTYVV